MPVATLYRALKKKWKAPPNMHLQDALMQVHKVSSYQSRARSLRVDELRLVIVYVSRAGGFQCVGRNMSPH